MDGSALAERAAKHVIVLRESGMALNVLLLNLQPEWAPARSEEEEREGVRLHDEAAERAMRSAESLLAGAGLRCEKHMRIGPAAESILEFARQQSCDQIVMGTRGLGAVSGMVLGSVAMKVVQLATIPVTLVK